MNISISTHCSTMWTSTLNFLYATSCVKYEPLTEIHTWRVREKLRKVMEIFKTSKEIWNQPNIQWGSVFVVVVVFFNKVGCMREAQSWEKMINSMKGGSIESAWSREVKRYEQRVIKDACTVLIWFRVAFSWPTKTTNNDRQTTSWWSFMMPFVQDYRNMRLINFRTFERL